MQYRQFGNTDLQVSAVCLGCWALAGGFNWGHQDRKDSLACVHAAIDAGIDFFDTAEGYGEGRSEELLGEALSGCRDDVTLATKASASHLTPDSMKTACDESLRRLKTDRIDLYQIHWRNPDVPLEDAVEGLERLKSQGKIRYCGVSNFGPGDLDALPDSATPVSNQIAYNLLFRAAEHEILPRCRRDGMAVMCYSPLMQGLLTGKFHSPDDVPEDRARTRLFSSERPYARHSEPGCEEAAFAALQRIRTAAERLEVPMVSLAVAWLLAQQDVATVIAGARTAAQARQNADCADIHVPAPVLKELTESTEPVKEALGANPDMWQTSARTQWRGSGR